MDFLGCLRQQAELRGRMLINASGHDKIFVRANGFQINQLHTIVDGVTQQIELPLAVKFVDKQISQVTFFCSPMEGFLAIKSTASSTSVATL